MLTTTDIEGPFYIDEAEGMNDVSMSRSDVRGCDGHRFVHAGLPRLERGPGSKNPPSGKSAMPAMQHTEGLVPGTPNVIVNGWRRAWRNL